MGKGNLKSYEAEVSPQDYTYLCKTKKGFVFKEPPRPKLLENSLMISTTANLKVFFPL